MNTIPYIDIHTHSSYCVDGTVTIQNIFPDNDFASTSSQNYFSAGLHPWYLKSPDENERLLHLLESTLKNEQAVFVGETGLDKRCSIDFEEQKKNFEAQIILSEKIKKPLIIHCVRAYNEVIEIHKKLSPKMTWIFHAYNGSLEMTKQLATENFLFSFGEFLFMHGTKAIESFKYLPLHKIFFETDENSDHVEQMYRQGAMLKKIPVEEIKKAIWDNFNRINNR